MWQFKPLLDLNYRQRFIVLPFKRKLKRVRRNGLRGTLVELCLRLLQLLLHFSKWCIYASVLGMIMLESLWSDESLFWWRKQ